MVVVLFIYLVCVVVVLCLVGFYVGLVRVVFI